MFRNLPFRIANRPPRRTSVSTVKVPHCGRIPRCGKDRTGGEVVLQTRKFTQTAHEPRRWLVAISDPRSVAADAAYGHNVNSPNGSTAGGWSAEWMKWREGG